MPAMSPAAKWRASAGTSTEFTDCWTTAVSGSSTAPTTYTANSAVVKSRLTTRRSNWKANFPARPVSARGSP